MCYTEEALLMSLTIYCAGLRVLDVSGIKTGDVNEVCCE